LNDPDRSGSPLRRRQVLQAALATLAVLPLPMLARAQQPQPPAGSAAAGSPVSALREAMKKGRVNGTAELSTDPVLIEQVADERRHPVVVIRVQVEQAYLHCAKAFMRSRLWSLEAQVERSALPTMGRMISEQTGLDTADETQEQMLARYQADL
jgi:hypothetical protein